MLFYASWLSKLGEVHNNWGLQVLNFVQQGQEDLIKGDPELVRMETSLKSLWKAIIGEGEGEGFWLQFIQLGLTEVAVRQWVFTATS